jgi:hypothetical protein
MAEEFALCHWAADRPENAGFELVQRQCRNRHAACSKMLRLACQARPKGVDFAGDFC